jgi:hypothetical protein
VATNPEEYYGRDIVCVQGADALFSEVVGIGVVRQDAIHRVLTDDVLGPGGDGWGRDCRSLLGIKAELAPSYAPIFEEVLTRDERVLTAEVQILIESSLTQLKTLTFEASCTTDLGPFTFTLIVSQVNSDTYYLQVL